MSSPVLCQFKDYKKNTTCQNKSAYGKRFCQLHINHFLELKIRKRMRTSDIDHEISRDASNESVQCRDSIFFVNNC